jgi:hypothetical protein
MNLSLSPLSGVPIGPLVGAPVPPEAVRGSRALRPPRGFHGTERPENVRFGGTAPRNRGHTQAQKMGLRYEQRVHDVLTAIYEERFLASPSILFEERYQCRRAILDGVLLFDDEVVVIEVKYTHTELAWWQLKRLYAPLLARLYLGRSLRCVEICRSYDPGTSFPSHRLVTSLHALPETEVGVIQWRL